MKLGTLLLRDGVISLAQLEAGLRAQVLYGGRLGTNLIDLGFVDIDTLADYLGRVHGYPVATTEHFERVPREVVAAFERDLAELYVAFPLGNDTTGNHGLIVAVADPTDGPIIEQLATLLGRPIIPYVAPELRIFYHLERQYGLVRRARYTRPGARNAPHAVAGERRRAQAPGGMEIPPPVRFEPGSDAESGQQPAVTSTEPPPPRLTHPSASLADVSAAILRAESRNQIGDAIISYAAGRFDAVAVFLLRDANAIGWRAYSATAPGKAQDALARIGLPLAPASVLQAANDGRSQFRGVAPSAGRPIERRLWAALDANPTPGEMVVVPVLVKARVVNLIYAHGLHGEDLNDDHVAGLIAIGSTAAEAYIRLIHKARKSARGDT